RRLLGGNPSEEHQHPLLAVPALPQDRERPFKSAREGVGGAPWGLASTAIASPATTVSAARRSTAATSARASATVTRGQHDACDDRSARFGGLFCARERGDEVA